MEGYRFIDKDPDVDLVRTAVFDSKWKIKDIAAKARVAPGTITKWLYGDTKKPQNYTMARVLDVLGIETVRRYKATGEIVVGRPELVGEYKKPRKSPPLPIKAAAIKVVKATPKTKPMSFSAPVKNFIAKRRSRTGKTPVS